MRAACGVDGMKHFLGMDVFAAARLRLEEIFDNFERVYVSFSGGKDSGVAVQYALQIAREKGRLPLDVLHVDLEAWYAHTDAFVTRAERQAVAASAAAADGDDEEGEDDWRKYL